jgi:hypothetical protein
MTTTSKTETAISGKQTRIRALSPTSVKTRYASHVIKFFTNVSNTNRYAGSNATQYQHILLLQSALQPLVGFRPAQLWLSILSRKVLHSAVATGTSNPQLGGEPGI